MSKKFLETIKISKNEVHNLPYHQARVDRAVGSGIHDLSSLVVAPGSDLLRCRVVYDRLNIDIEYLAYTKRQINSLKLIYKDAIEYSHKYEDRTVLDNLYALREECDDILIVKNGLICDTSIANIALFDGKVWWTPKSPLLQGTSRARHLKEEKIFEKEIRGEDIYTYKKIALMNAMIDFDIIAVENIKDTIC